MTTINKDLEIYLDWLNDFYSEDFLNTMDKGKRTEDRNNFYQNKPIKIDNIQQYEKEG